MYQLFASCRQVVVFKDLDHADLRSGDKCSRKGEKEAKGPFYKVPSLLFDIEVGAPGSRLAGPVLLCRIGSDSLAGC